MSTQRFLRFGVALLFFCGHARATTNLKSASTDATPPRRQQDLSTTTVTASNQSTLVANLNSDTTINIGADIYLLNSLRTPDVTTGIIIDNGQSNLVIDGMGVYKVDGQATVRIFYISGYADVVIKNLEITNSGYMQEGGGLLILNGTVGLVSCTISGNSARYGGGFYIDFGSSANLVSCNISGNVGVGPMVGLGGGLYISGANVSLTSCSISENVAGYGGGGIFLDSGFLLLAGCSFFDNRQPTNVPESSDLLIAFDETPLDQYSLTILSTCPGGSYNAGSGTLDCSLGLNEGTCGTYPADLLYGNCTACPTPTPFSCCGATAETDCASSEPLECSDDELALCPSTGTL